MRGYVSRITTQIPTHPTNQSSHRLVYAYSWDYSWLIADCLSKHITRDPPEDLGAICLECCKLVEIGCPLCIIGIPLKTLFGMDYEID
jgi:hypothetical protein